MTDTEPRPRDSFVRLPAVCRLTGWGKTTVYRKIAEGVLPPPQKIAGGRSSHWHWGTLLDALGKLHEGGSKRGAA